MKKEGQNGLTSLRGKKPLKIFEGKRQKSCFESLTDRREREKLLKILKKCSTCEKLMVYKKNNKKINSLCDF